MRKQNGAGFEVIHKCHEGVSYGIICVCHIMLSTLSVSSLYRRAILCSVHFLFYHCTDGALCHIMLCTLSVSSLYRRCPMPYYALYTFCFITVHTVPYAILCSVHFLFYHCTDGALCHIMFCTLSVLSLYRRCPMPYYALYTFCFIAVQTPYYILYVLYTFCFITVQTPYYILYVLYTFCFVTVQTVVTLVPDANTQPIRIERCAANTEMFGYRNQATTVDKELQ